MSLVKLEAKIRKETGKGVARSLRREGRVPAVLYGRHLEEPIVLDLESKQVENLLQNQGRSAIINIVFDEKDVADQLAMLADYQRDVYGTYLLNVDFKQIKMDEKVTASIPIVFVGTSIGLQAGGVLEEHIREVEVEGLPMAIPSHIEVDITDLDLGHHLTVAGIPCPEGITILNDASEQLISIAIPRSVATEEATEEAAPEAAAPAAE